MKVAQAKKLMGNIAYYGIQHHGEIFMEYFRDGITEKVTLKSVSKEQIDILQEQLQDEPDNSSILPQITQLQDGKYLDYWIEYFKCASSHGELAGSISAACLNDENEYAFNEISKHFSQDGWDS